MSRAMSLKYRISSVDQRPVRSGLPSGRRGVGALRSTSPAAVRGAFEGGTLIHCAGAGSSHMPSTPTARNEMFFNCMITTHKSTAPSAEDNAAGVLRCYRAGLASASFVVGLISTRYAWYGTLPRFSIECSGWLVESNVTCISFSSARGVFFPSGERRWDGGSRKYTTTAGQVWVCHGSFSPGGTRTLSTRTYAFSRTTEIFGS